MTAELPSLLSRLRRRPSWAGSADGGRLQRKSPSSLRIFAGVRSLQPVAVLQIEKPRWGTPGFSGLSDQHLGEFDRSHSKYSTDAGSSTVKCQISTTYRIMPQLPAR